MRLIDSILRESRWQQCLISASARHGAAGFDGLVKAISLSALSINRPSFFRLPGMLPFEGGANWLPLWQMLMLKPVCVGEKRKLIVLHGVFQVGTFQHSGGVKSASPGAIVTTVCLPLMLSSTSYWPDNTKHRQEKFIF